MTQKNRPGMILSAKDKKKGLIIPTQMTSEMAYLAGVFAGDGSLSFRPDKQEYSLKCVGNPKDEKEFYFEVVGPRFKKVFGFLPQIKYFDQQITFGFRIFSKSLVIYLTDVIDLPLGSKYNSLKVPLIFKANKKLLISFIKGVFDTDGCISFKKKYQNIPYYPVISFSSKNEAFVKEISNILKEEGFKITERYSYKVKDFRIKSGFTTISRIELNGKANLALWLEKIGFFSPKHLEKVRTYWNGN